MENVIITYIGGGSRAWARKMFCDVLMQDNFCGKIRLYDIDKSAASDNKIIAEMLSLLPEAKSKWDFEVSDTLEASLNGADFVFISILPGTFEDMRSDIHTPEAYRIYQSVGDTTGPGGIFRAMRTVPMYVAFARAIEKCCPKAFVINFTNPMAVCVNTLYKVFPAVKAFGCCHEVFGTQEFLAKVIQNGLGVSDIDRHDIDVDVLGVNHFTWFTRAEYKGTDIFPVYRAYIDKNFDFYSYHGDDINHSSELIKMDLFRRYKQIAAAGDRHLAEFLNNNWYLRDGETVKKWSFLLTPIEWRIKDQQIKIKITQEIINKTRQPVMKKSGEEFVRLVSAILGFGDCKSNVNLPNAGQADFAPQGTVVETNALFSKGAVKPVGGKPLNALVRPLVYRAAIEQENIVKAAIDRNLNDMFSVFISDPLCSSLSLTEAEELFETMTQNAAAYLKDWN